MFHTFDVIVVGGGHAGAEASVASARLGAKTLLITQNIDTICHMSCNPAMGGVAKGQIVREIDAMGGCSGIVADRTTIQFRMLNRSKGPAMWSPRAQCDKVRFSLEWRRLLENTPNLSLWQDEVTGVLLQNGKACGVRTRMGIEISSKVVVLTNGTFLSGIIHIGESNWPGGRIGEEPASLLSNQLRECGFVTERLKTGTPVRIDGRSIDFSILEEQPGDDNPGQFSFLESRSQPLQQRSCYITCTNNQTHDILRTGFDKSPLYAGRIQGHGPRYCPSIEDKIVRFADKDRHQLFVEPEGMLTLSYYLNGFSSSLPLDVQLSALHTIKGFEHARILKPGYAIEYDYFPPTQLSYSLETKIVENLFFAGQINGTTGYEEAAGQGLVAGINAAMKVKNKPPLVFNRGQAYIGVLIDDLVSKGVDEPYRMFTSRAEYRILLRQDNADERLTPISYQMGLAGSERMRRVEEKLKGISAVSDFMSDTAVSPSDAQPVLEQKGSALLSQRVRLSSLITRPEIEMGDLMSISSSLNELVATLPDELRAAIVEGVEIGFKYSRYIEKEQDVANRILKFDDLRLPDSLDYFSIHAISYEAREKLTKMHPATIGQASRISGVSPADISALLIYMQQR